MQYICQLAVHNCDMINAFRSIQFLPLEQQLFLRIHNFVNSIESMYPVIRHCILLHKERVVWSGLRPDHLYTFNEYLRKALIPSINEDSLSLAVKGLMDQSRFVVGPNKCDRKPIPMYLYNDDSGNQREEYQMVVFSAKNMICCLLLDQSPSEEFYTETQVPLTTQLVTISSEIDAYLRQGASTAPNSTTTNSSGSGVSSTQANPSTSEALSSKFLYLNKCNLRHSGPLTGKNGALSRDLINILMDLHGETDERNISEETIVKTMNDYWLFRKNCNSRSFFVLINKYATLIEISDEANKMFGQQVQDVFFE